MIEYIKMHNAGNDYIYCFSKPLTKCRIRALCDRHRGIGGDGMVFIRKEPGYHAFDIYNADGSLASFCGNAAICAGRLLYDRGLEKNDEFELLTGAGFKRVKIIAPDKRGRVRVNIGYPVFSLQKEQYSQGGELFNRKLELRGSLGKVKAYASAVWAGNLHLVVFTRDFQAQSLYKTACAVNESGLFPDGINIEFIAPSKDGKSVAARVYERGSGFTLACASGAAAIFAVLRRMGAADATLAVRYEKGTINVSEDEGKIFICGAPRYAFVAYK